MRRNGGQKKSNKEGEVENKNKKRKYRFPYIMRKGKNIQRRTRRLFGNIAVPVNFTIKMINEKIKSGMKIRVSVG